MNARRPDLFIPGAPKAGTTSIAGYLSEHPNIYISVPKEPAYWGADFPAYLREKYAIRSRSDYLALFECRKAKEAHWAGEASTHYLVSYHAVEEILSFSPGAHFLVMLRNPVDLVHALHQEQMFKQQEVVEDFELAWQLQARRARGEAIPATCRVPRFLQYAEVAALGTQLDRLLGQVERSRVFMCFLDDMRVNPSAEYRRILAWLNVPDDGRTDFPRANPSKQQRSRTLARLLHAPPRPLIPIIHATRWVFRSRRIGVGNLVDRMMTRPVERAPLRPDFRKRLCEHFEPEIARIEEITGRDLYHWRS